MLRKTLIALALAGASTGAHAVAVTSLTVEEIGGVAGMTMATATADLSHAGISYGGGGAIYDYTGASGGLFYFGSEVGDGLRYAGSATKVWGTTDTPDNIFAPASGHTDGQITMGGVQGNGEMSDGFRYGGPFESAPNSVNGPLYGSWSGVDGANTLILDLSGFGWWTYALYWQYNMSPDAGTLHTNTQTIGGVTYYTADWSHVIALGEDYELTGQRADWHMEGVLVVPEPETYAMMLTGLGLIGLIAASRRRGYASNTNFW